MKKLSIPLLVSALALSVAACGSSSTSTSTSTSKAASTTTKTAAVVVIGAQSESGLGTVLVDSSGKTLYQFVPDAGKHVTCTGSCATVWPPVMLPSGAKLKASGGIEASLLGSDPDPSGGRVVTYAGWPLYTYVSDGSPGSHTGQGINLNGGLWYVMSPSGKAIK
jgi:predicted lipoprotein with Yx(FWY)xxD motif